MKRIRLLGLVYLLAGVITALSNVFSACGG